MRKNGGYALIFFVIFIIVVAVAAYAVLSRVSSSQPVVTIDASVNPRNFKTTGSASLEIHLRNQDQNETHSVLLRFVTNQMVHIFLGQNELSIGESANANYTYTLLLQPGQGTIQPFTIKVPALPIGIPHQDFYVTIETSIDGMLQNILEKKITFTAESD